MGKKAVSLRGQDLSCFAQPAPPALERANKVVRPLRILRLLEEAGDGLSSEELAQSLGHGCSPKTVAKDIKHLRQAGFSILESAGEPEAGVRREDVSRLRRETDSPRSSGIRKVVERRWIVSQPGQQGEEDGFALRPSEVLSLLLTDQPSAMAQGASSGYRQTMERLRHRLEARLTPRGRRWLQNLRETAKAALPSELDESRLTQYRFSVLRGNVYDYVLELKPDIAHTAREHVWHPSQRVHELGNGGVYLTFRAAGLSEVASWIASLGGKAQAVAPPELVSAVVQLHCQGIESHRAGVVYLEDLKIPGMVAKPPISATTTRIGGEKRLRPTAPKLRVGGKSSQAG